MSKPGEPVDDVYDRMLAAEKPKNADAGEVAHPESAAVHGAGVPPGASQVEENWTTRTTGNSLAR